MSRWRPPAPKSSPYITPQGYRALENELKALWVRRAEVTTALSAAAAEGDRSENAEYIYRKKELREIDGRIRYLQKRMPLLNIVAGIQDQNRVFFGARVSLETETGELMDIRIVGADELDTESGHISIDSPLARALLGKHLDDTVEYRVMGKQLECTIMAIEYPVSD